MSSPKYVIIFHLKHEHTLHYDYATVRKDGAVSFFTPVRDGMLFETKQDAYSWIKCAGESELRSAIRPGTYKVIRIEYVLVDIQEEV